jgi:hypothetical protein
VSDDDNSVSSQADTEKAAFASATSFATGAALRITFWSALAMAVTAAAGSIFGVHA